MADNRPEYTHEGGVKKCRWDDERGVWIHHDADDDMDVICTGYHPSLADRAATFRAEAFAQSTCDPAFPVQRHFPDTLDGAPPLGRFAAFIDKSREDVRRSEPPSSPHKWTPVADLFKALPRKEDFFLVPPPESLGFDPVSETEPFNGKIGMTIGSDGVHIFPRPPATPEAAYIVEHLMRRWLDLFLEKNAKYKRVNETNDLGPRGHFPDINRKVGVLRDRVWEGNESPGEPTKEVIYDLIGHLFLMIADMEMEKP